MVLTTPMNRPKHLNNTSLFGLLAIAASALGACSSDDARPAGVSSTEEPNDPARTPSATAPSSPTQTGSDGGTVATAAPPSGDCKTAAPSNACGVSPQCGCASAQTCDVVDSVGTAKCVSSGTAPMGHPCDATAQCAAGNTCIFGVCHAFCSDPSTACTLPRTGACAQIKTTEGAEIPNLAICRVACDLHDSATCGTAVCRVDDKGETECQPKGTRNEGEKCTPDDDCGPGLVCTSSSSSSACKHWCRVGATDCGAGKKCAGFSNEVKVRGVVYGACS